MSMRISARSGGRVPLAAFFVIFTASGFSGLIYESIWSHYLKLLLGHAAHAQTLVLAIFMGGMAIGAWFAGRRSGGWANLLLGYAIVEAAIGLCALVFHPGFKALIQFLHTSVAPALGSPAAIDTAKWSLAALSILPQSVLLGMTFPLMTAGILRRYPQSPGRSLATLYFCNSLGAAAGVLASGFWLIAEFGLPGTIITAGAINLLLAGTVWGLARDGEPVPLAAAGSASAPAHPQRDPAWAALLIVALGTGLASFIYELGWIRMLSMVLGAATHAFELMLSAFILGLALGGWWIRSRIDRLADAPAFLGAVQIVMGLCALASLALYDQAFTAMRWLLQALARSEDGYTLFMLGSHGLALFIMLPATFCAGMTLPLITHVLLRRGAGERAIGAVYAANTVGAILGVAFMVHVGMPLLGLRNAMTAGAVLDLGLGLAILGAARGPRRLPRLALGTGVAAAAVGAVVFLVELDPYRMASGVYRYGRASLPADNRIVYHRDGKTATVNLIATPEGTLSITTNGKPDAAINMAPQAEAAADEPTMVLAAAIPLALRPQARTVANIGMGSGLTTSTLLASPRLELVDTIEIEAAMVEAAQGFRPRVDRAYDDPRSRIHIDDAKTFFVTRRQRYDIIVSEPSNPWVSGVASLFSREFYDLVTDHLAADGVLVQWMQAYEIDLELIASVISALGEHFEHYVIYHTDNSNILIVAANGADLERTDAGIFAEPALAAELARVGIRNLDDLRMHRLADRRTLEPLFSTYGVPANSDYFPFVDQRAARARYMGRDALALVSLADAPLPLLAMLDAHRGPPPARPTPRRYNLQVDARERAQRLFAALIGDGPRALAAVPPALLAQAALLAGDDLDCSEGGRAEAWMQALFRIANVTAAHLTDAEARALWSHLRRAPCMADLAPVQRQWFDLLTATGLQQAAAMQRAAGALLAADEATDDEQHGYLLASAMLGALAQARPDEALAIWRRFGAPRWQPNSVNIFLRLLIARAVQDVALDGGPGVAQARP